MDNFIEFLYAKFLLSDGVSIDTRTIQPDNLFFAVRGPNFNANTYAEEALNKKASYAVVDDAQYVTNDRIILADDGLKALQELAIFHRSRYKRKLLAITGSNGKTTTKELIRRVLSSKYIVHATEGNFNNHIGVPLTLLQINPQVEVAIIEMGANKVGDINELCGYANPNFGLITNIGHAHTEGFGGFDGVIRGKSELFDHLRKHDGHPFINEEDRVLSNMKKRFAEKTLFPNEDIQFIEANPYVSVRIGDKQVKTHLIGQYNYSNITAAIAVGRQFEIADDQIIEAITSYIPDNSRSQVIKKESNTIILDAYNANPDSMKAALTNLATFSGKKIAVLGDMNELSDSEVEHHEILAYARKLDLYELLLIGENMQRVQGKNDHWFKNKEELLGYIEDSKLENTTILFKASRSLILEEVVSRMQN